MKRPLKENVSELLEIIGNHLRKYRIMAIVFLGIISLLDIGFSIAWFISDDIVANEKEVAYYILQGIVLGVSLIYIFLMILGKKEKISNMKLAVAYHIYGFLLMAWATLVYMLDLTLGEPSIIYLMIGTIIAGLFVVEPIFFTFFSVLSLISILIYFSFNPNEFFDGTLIWENVFNLVAYAFVIVLLALRNYRVTIREHRAYKKLEEMSYIDELTGLYNERSYISEIESINNRIDDGEDVKFAVVLMDLNNLKATNDKYGHRFGCSLVVRCGQTIPDLFPTSKCFHVGGDEFIIIVYGDDYDNFEERLKNFDEKMIYSIVQFDGVDLIFSVARGYSIRKENEHYKDVLQIADSEMYIHKKYVKEKYNLAKR